MKVIDKQIRKQLYLEAINNPRKRSHHLLHASHQDKVQRLLIGLVQGSYVEPHYHEKEHQWEMFFVLEGKIKFNIHDKNGYITKTFMAGEDENITAIELKPFEVHSLECISDKSLLLEIKEGPFDPNFAKSFLMN